MASRGQGRRVSAYGGDDGQVEEVPDDRHLSQEAQHHGEEVAAEKCVGVRGSERLSEDERSAQQPAEGPCRAGAMHACTYPNKLRKPKNSIIMPTIVHPHRTRKSPRRKHAVPRYRPAKKTTVRRTPIRKVIPEMKSICVARACVSGIIRIW